jgi:hypothetical protein
MTKITYDENNKEEVELVEDYFWYSYYLEEVESSILMNREIRTMIYNYFTYANHQIRYKISKSLIDILNTFMNEYEFKKFIEISYDLLYVYNKQFIRDMYEDKNHIILTILYYILRLGKKHIQEVYKTKLIENLKFNYSKLTIII